MKLNTICLDIINLSSLTIRNIDILNNKNDDILIEKVPRDDKWANWIRLYREASEKRNFCLIGHSIQQIVLKGNKIKQTCSMITLNFPDNDFLFNKESTGMFSFFKFFPANKHTKIVKGIGKIKEKFFWTEKTNIILEHIVPMGIIRLFITLEQYNYTDKDNLFGNSPSKKIDD